MRDEVSQVGGISRRNFIRLAVSSLVPLVRVAGGYIVPAQAQELEEQDEASYGVQTQDASEGASDPTTVITLVMADEVGLFVGDTTVPSNAPVGGAHVVLTSRYNGKVLEGDTGADGIIKFKVGELSENPDNKSIDRLEEYAFNGSIKVTCAGYREFETGLIRVKGGEPLFVPTNPLDGKTPYPRMVGMDEWDALYTENEFICAKGNTDDHDLRIQWYQMGAGTVKVEVRDRANGRVIASKNAVVTGGVLDTTITGKLLMEGDAACLPPGGALDIAVIQGSTTYVAPISLKVEKGAADEEKEQPKVTLKPLNTGGSSKWGVGATWPKDVPIFGGSALKTFAPDTCFNVSFNPWGYLQITVKTPEWGYKRDTGPKEDSSGKKRKQGWGSYPRKSVKDQFNSMVKDAKKMNDAAAGAFSSDSNISKIDTFGKVSATLTLQGVVAALWDQKQHLFQGNAGLQAFCALNLSYTMNYLVGPIPLLVTFALDSSFIFSVSAGFFAVADENQSAIEAAFMFDRYKWDLANTGLTITINISPSLTVGVGIRGVASISVQGKINITMVFGFDIFGVSDDENIPYPHEVYNFAYQMFVVVHLFLVTLNFKILDVPLADPIDNWKGLISVQSAEERVMRAMADDPDIMDSLVPVTEEMLEKTCEFVLDEDEEDPFGDELASFDWSQLREPDLVSNLSDGCEMHYTVYRMMEDDGTGLFEQADDVIALGGDDDAEVVPVRRRRNMRAPRYVPTQSSVSDLLVVQDGDPSLPEPAIAGIGSQGGIRPSSDKVIAEAIYGDPRMKVVDVRTNLGSTMARATCCLRIGSVNIGSQDAPVMRSRLIMTILGAGHSGSAGDADLSPYVGTSVVLDFDTDDVDVARRDLFDYDVDVDLTTRGGIDVVHVVLISGRRELVDTGADMASKVANIASDLYFTYLCFEATNAFAAGGVTYLTHQTRGASTDLGSGVEDELYHSISNIEIATDGEDDSRSLLVCYLDRRSQSVNDVAAYGSEGCMTRVSFFCIDLTGDTPRQIVPDRSLVDEYLPDRDCAIYQLYLSPCMDFGGELGRVYTITMMDTRESHVFVVRLGTDEQSGLTVIDLIRECAVIDGSLRLIPWPHQNCFLVSYPSEEYIAEMNASDLWKHPDQWDRSKWRLHKAKWVLDAGTPVLEVEPIGPENFNFTSFGTNTSGNFIFWPQTRQADVEGLANRIYDKDGSYESEPEASVNQLMACRIRGGHFSDPFIVADLPHEMNGLEIVRTFDELSPLEVLSTELYATGEVDPNGKDVLHAARLWYTSIPNLQCATATGCVAPVPLVEPGGTIRFLVTIRNDGNCYLKGCKVEMYVHEDVVFDQDGKVVSERIVLVEDSRYEITFKESIVESAYNPMQDGVIQNVEPDGALAPGKSSAYEVYVKIPADWGADGNDKKRVSFHAFEPKIAEGGSIAQDEEQVVIDESDAIWQTYAVEPGMYEPFLNRSTPDIDRHQHFMSTLTIEGVEIEDMHNPAPVTFERNGGSGANPDDSGTFPGSGTKPGEGVAHTHESSSGGGHWYDPLTTPYADPTHAGVTTGGSGGSRTGTSTVTTTTPATDTTQARTTTTPATGTTQERTTTTPATAAQSKVTPSTADPTPSALPVALAAAGAAALAYERRRAKNEDR